MHEDINKLKNDFDSIEVPEEIDFVIEKAIKRGRQQKRKRIYKPFATVAAVLVTFIFTVNASPAFAGYVSKVPGLEGIVKMVQFDKGLEKAALEGMGQVVNKSVSDKGITLTVESLIYDGRNLVIAYEIKSDKKLQRLGHTDFELMDSQGKKLEVSASIWSPQGEDTNTFKGLLQFGHEGFVYPEDITLACSSIEHLFDSPEGGKTEEIKGNWQVSVKLDKNLATIEPKLIEINKNFSVDNLNFTAEYIKIYPTVVDVKIIMDKNNPLKVTSFQNLRLIDERGNEYKSNSASVPEGQWIGHFESSYFINPSKLTLAFDAIYTMPHEDQYIIFDIEKEKILEDSGYKVEFLGKSSHSNSWTGKNTLDVSFKINDEEYLSNANKQFWIDQEVYDENNKVHHISFGTSTREKEVEYYSLMFDTESGVPKIAKVKILGISKGIIRTVKIPLK